MSSIQHFFWSQDYLNQRKFLTSNISWEKNNLLCTSVTDVFWSHICIAISIMNFLFCGFQSPFRSLREYTILCEIFSSVWQNFQNKLSELYVRHNGTAHCIIDSGINNKYNKLNTQNTWKVIYYSKNILHIYYSEFFTYPTITYNLEYNSFYNYLVLSYT